MDLEKILPNNGPSIEEVKKYINKYSNDIIVIKCGGSVLLEKKLFDQFIEDIAVINKLGLSAVVVHGGGKNIKKKLDKYNLKSEFIDGLRVTDEKTIKVVEEALLELNFEILNDLKGNWKKGYVLGKLLNLDTGEDYGYPVLELDNKGSKIHGMILESKDIEKNINKIDEFEGKEYLRVVSNIFFEDGSKTLAYVYVRKK